MAKSSLLGIERAATEADGRDSTALGPSDSSDSGSDVAGIEDLDNGDPAEPVDVTLADASGHSMLPPDSARTGGSDSAGTGERRSAGADAGRREAADISTDHIVDANGVELPDDDEDPDLGFIDDAQAEDEYQDPDELPVEEGGAGLPSRNSPTARGPKRPPSR